MCGSWYYQNLFFTLSFGLLCWVVYNRYNSVPLFSLFKGHGQLFSFNLSSTELRLVLQKCVIPARQSTSAFFLCDFHRHCAVYWYNSLRLTVRRPYVFSGRTFGNVRTDQKFVKWPSFQTIRRKVSYRNLCADIKSKCAHTFYFMLVMQGGTSSCAG